jgi:hypothetical protein
MGFMIPVMALLDMMGALATLVIGGRVLCGTAIVSWAQQRRVTDMRLLDNWGGRQIDKIGK